MEALSKYRLVLKGDTISDGDELLRDDCEHWEPVTGWPLGLEYNPSFFVPVRRPIKN